MFQQRTWILQRSNIEILRECQRFVLDQFSEKLSLNQKDLIEKIFYFSAQSQNKPFHAAVERLKHSLVEAAFDITQLPGCDPLGEVLPEESEANAEKSKSVKALRAAQTQVANASDSTKTYRGRAVPMESTYAPMGGEVVETKKAHRIYRGRKVER